MNAMDNRLAACDYCGLPLAAGWGGSLNANEQHPQYCCSGCRVAAEVAGSPDAPQATQKLLMRLGIAVFLTLNVVAFTMALWGDDVYGPTAAAHPAEGPLTALFLYLCLLLSLPVAWLLGLPLAAQAWQQLRQWRISSDLLLLAGVCAAFGVSIVAVIQNDKHVYFEVGCVVLTLVALGRFLESQGKSQAMAALRSLTGLLPETALRQTIGGAFEETSLDAILPGDVLRCLAGQRIAVDGKIIQGTASIDEQAVTGESQPRVKHVGDDVYCGTLNLDGTLLIRATAAPREGSLQRMVDAVLQARLDKSRYQRLAERIAAWFLPLVMAIALVTFSYHAWQGDPRQGILVALAVLLISCPCALGIATPLAAWTAIGRASRAQVLIRGGDALERLAGVKAILLDKTGTLTDGQANVSQFVYRRGECAGEVLEFAAHAASGSTHPLSQAILRFTIDGNISSSGESGIHVLPGLGVELAIDNHEKCYLGSPRLMQRKSLEFDETLDAVRKVIEQSGAALVCVGWSGLVRGLFCLDEHLRPEAQVAIAELHRAGLHLEILTGDHHRRAESVGSQLQTSVRAEMLPEDKVAAIREMQSRFGPVAMIGDGINDASALAAADVGIAMGCGVDVSRHTADICLLGSDLRRVAWTIRLAQRTVRTIRLNLFWAFVYNVGGVGLALTGRLNPVWAAVAMVVSGLLVIVNSIRLGSVTIADIPALETTMHVPVVPATTSSEPRELIEAGTP